MRKLALLFAAAAVACGPKTDTPPADTSGTVSTAASNNTNDVAGVDSLRSAWGAAAEKKDAATIAAMYSDDAYLQFPMAPAAHGHDEILKALTQAVGMTSNLKINSEKTEIGGDLAVDYGSYSEHVAPPGAQAMDVNGRFVVVLKKNNGAWKIVNHMGWIPPAK